MKKNQSNDKHFFVALVAIVAVVGLVLGIGNGGSGLDYGTASVAMSPGTGGGVTDATGLARDCIVDLYGSAGQIPAQGVNKASVDDTIAQCVKARGGQIVTGGTCDPSGADGCSNTFSGDGQDPDSDPVAAVIDVTASDGTTGSFTTTVGGQVICEAFLIELPPMACGCIGDFIRNSDLSGCDAALAAASACGLADYLPRIRECPAGGGGGCCVNAGSTSCDSGFSYCSTITNSGTCEASEGCDWLSGGGGGGGGGGSPKCTSFGGGTPVCSVEPDNICSCDLEGNPLCLNDPDC